MVNSLSPETVISQSVENSLCARRSKKHCEIGHKRLLMSSIETENRLPNCGSTIKLEKCLIPQDFEGQFFHLDISHFTFLTQNTPLRSKIRRKTSKNYVFEKLAIYSLNVALLPPQNSGLSVKFYYILHLVMIEVCLAKIWFIFLAIVTEKNRFKYPLYLRYQKGFGNIGNFYVL